MDKNKLVVVMDSYSVFDKGIIGITSEAFGIGMCHTTDEPIRAVYSIDVDDKGKIFVANKVKLESLNFCDHPMERLYYTDFRKIAKNPDACVWFFKHEPLLSEQDIKPGDIIMIEVRNSVTSTQQAYCEDNFTKIFEVQKINTNRFMRWAQGTFKIKSLIGAEESMWLNDLCIETSIRFNTEGGTIKYYRLIPAHTASVFL
jgi:hypothetical protein